MSNSIFQGFSPKTIQFLKDLENNNNKEWFEDNRQLYENELLNPFKALVTTLASIMCSIDSSFEIRPHRVLSRIYRDTRFSKNKDPYKTYMWMAFQQSVNSGEWINYPGFFMEFSAKGYIYGVGYGGAKRAIMDDVRDNITFRSEEFRHETEKLIGEHGFEIGGEIYKRPLINNLPEYYQQWMQRKTFWLSKQCLIGEEVFSNELVQKIAIEYKSLEWLYNFLKESQPE